MLFPKIVKAAAVAMVVLLSNMNQTNACTCIAVYFTPCDYVTGLASPDTSLVVKATALSRSLQTDINDPVTYTVDVTAVFLGDTGGQNEITFVTGGNSAACGVFLEIGEEYVLGLSPAVVDPFDPADVEGQLAVNLCGLARKWNDLPEDETASLEAGCTEEDPCLSTCDEFQECVQYLKNGKYYCSDTCDDYPCVGCQTRPRGWCRHSGFEGCPEKRTCSAV